MSLQEFKDILTSVADSVYHFEADGEDGDEYVIWQETGGHGLYGSGMRCEAVRKIQVEVYTRDEFTETVGRLLGALEENDIAFQEPVTVFDPDTKMIRHIIECEVP